MSSNIGLKTTFKAFQASGSLAPSINLIQNRYRSNPNVEPLECIMQSDVKVIEYLNTALRQELTAINQYWLHYRFLQNWGLLDMAKVWRKDALTLARARTVSRARSRTIRSR